MAISVLSDAPAIRDLLGFERYLDPLIELITSEALETPLTIGIFGSWGSGKSTLLGMLARRLKALDGRFLCVEFNPWVFRKEPNLLIPLLHALHDTMKQSLGGKFKDSAGRIADVLLRLGADVSLRLMTADKVDLNQLDKLEKAYLERQGLVHNQLRNLRETLRTQAKTLYESGVTVVLIIDDLDRCDPTEIVDLLESVKLFLDVEHVIHVLAVDKEVIDRGVEVKYRRFKFADQRKASLGAEYLEKLIQIPVYLYPLSESQITGFIKAHDLSPETADQLELLARGLSPNPRKIKRVLNAIALTRHSLNAKEMDWSLVTALAILRIEQPEIYADVAKMPSLLIALQRVYANDWSTKDDRDFVRDFADRATFVRERCAAYYRPASPLAPLFAVDFAAAKDSLTRYVSVLGG